MNKGTIQELSFAENLSVFHVGTIEPHCYFIPFEPDSDPFNRRELSNRFELLNGDWDFAYYDRSKDLVSSQEEIEFSKKIKVPSNWQLSGFGFPWYTNIQYPIPFDPPFVPDNNAAGVYRRKYFYHPDGMRRFLIFEGVDSCLYLYINGVFSGYSQVSHCPSEFDISEKLVPGNNEICVVVLQYCDGTYLEDQDKWRLSGIFRDVYVLSRPEKSIKNYKIETNINDDVASIIVSLTGDLDADIVLSSREGDVIESQILPANQKAVFKIEQPKMWNAEQPYLYSLLIKTDEEWIGEKVGIRTVDTKDGKFKVNGSTVKLRGVNRHDSNPITGYYCTYEQMYEDLLIMKANNINALRCSHYPNSPLLYQIADELGLYVFDEADIESHGCATVVSKYEKERRIALLASDERFHEAILDRIKLLVTRDINRPCVVAWSLGNESGYGTNFSDAAKWIHSCDKTRPVHYENIVTTDETSDADLDFRSFMYASPNKLISLLKDENEHRPIVQCEYSHSMGLGPGDLKDYWDVYYSDSRFAGGFIWEFRDHGIYCGKTSSGKDIYKYGGDFGEPYHDGDFCLDALCFPNNTPHSGMKEAKNIYRPVHVRLTDYAKGEFEFTSRLDFEKTSELLACEYVLEEAGVSIFTRNLALDLNPHETKRLVIPELGKAKGNDLFVTFRFLQKKDVPWAKPGTEIGFDQIELKRERQTELKLNGQAVIKEEKDQYVVVSGQKSYIISKRTGLPVSIRKGSNELLNGPVEFNLFRAPISNDCYIRDEWQKCRLDCLSTKVKEMSTRADSDGKQIIRSQLSLSGGITVPVAEIDLTMVFGNDGMIFIARTKMQYDFQFLPRFGLRFLLKHEFNKINYLGYGPNESYVDMRRSSRYGFFEALVENCHNDYIRPQENGSHYGTRKLCVISNGCNVEIMGTKDFSFSVSEYTQEELYSKKHNWELQKSESTVLCVDYGMSGVGSNSCGPVLAPEYSFNEKKFCFELKVGLD